MMMKMTAFALFGFAAATETSVNPIRKVVTLLQEMQKEMKKMQKEMQEQMQEQHTKLLAELSSSSSSSRY